MPSADAAAEGGEEPPPREEGEGGGGGDDDNDDVSSTAVNGPEKQLTCFVRSVVLGEWVGNAFGTLALAWASTVLLGGLCSSLNSQDSWFCHVHDLRRMHQVRPPLHALYCLQWFSMFAFIISTVMHS